MQRALTDPDAQAEASGYVLRRVREVEWCRLARVPQTSPQSWPRAGFDQGPRRPAPGSGA